MKLSLIGAPCDAGANTLGAALGPLALRKAGLQSSLQQLGYRVHDLGDLRIDTLVPQADVQGYRHFHEVLAWNRAVHSAVAGVIGRGGLPVLLGGDHALAVGSVSAVAAYCRREHKPLRVVWLDAHADFNTAETSGTGNMHGMPLTLLCGFGPAGLTQLGGFSPALEPSQLRLLGVRSIDPMEQLAIRCARLPVFTMQQIQKQGLERVMDMILAGILPGTHVHVSFDLDCLDPLVAPGVSTPETGGLQLGALRYCMGRIAQTGCVGSVDLVELNPLADPAGLTAQYAVELLEVLLSPVRGTHAYHSATWAEHAG